MGFHCSGKLNIPNEEFWEWAQKHLGCEYTYEKNIYITKTADDLVFTATESKEHHYIEMASFWEFANSYIPSFNAESSMGIPRFLACDIEISFCVNTESVDGCALPDFIEIKNQWKKLRSGNQELVLLND